MRAGRLRLGVVAAVVAGSVLAVGACAGDDGGDAEELPNETSPAISPEERRDAVFGDSALPDPCGLLTLEEIDDITGLAFAPGVPNLPLTDEGQHVCDWVEPTDEITTVQVLVHAEDVYASNEATATELMGGADVVDIPGTDAAYATAEGSVVGLQVGGRFLQVSFIAGSGADTTEATLALAEQAATALTAG